MIDSKEKIINYFKSGFKEPKNFKIGIEHEKFLFNNTDNKRIDYSKINLRKDRHLIQKKIEQQLGY